MHLPRVSRPAEGCPSFVILKCAQIWFLPKYSRQPDELNWLLRSGRHFRSAPLIFVSFSLRDYENFRHPGPSNLARETASAAGIHAVTAESESVAAFDAASMIAEPLPVATHTWKSICRGHHRHFQIACDHAGGHDRVGWVLPGRHPIRHQFV